MRNILKIKNPSTGEFEPIAAISGADGAPGANGQGVPTGGTVGQILRKTGSGDYETGWSDSAGDSEKLGGVAAAQYALKNNVPAHNLLDNSDFTNPVNQRGATSYSGYSYGIDRWFGSALYQTVSIQNNYITVSANGTSYVGIKQKVLDMTKLAGKTVTFAAQVYSSVGTRIAFIDGSGNAIAKSDGVAGQNQILIVTCTVPSDATSDSVIPIIISKTQAKGDSANIYWAALYEGSYTADTLPAYQPKGYATELAEAQRYYQQYNIEEMSAVGSYESGKTFIRCQLSTPMRIAPSLVQSSVNMWTTYNGVDNVAQEFIFYKSTPQVVNLKCANTHGSDCQLVIATNSAVMSFSADL